MKTSHAFLLIGAALAWAGSARAQLAPDAKTAYERARATAQYRVAIQKCDACAGAVKDQYADAAKLTLGK